MMSKFLPWFTKEYKQWVRSHPGEEDFLAFCELIGYSPAKVLSWLQGDSVPQVAEILSIAGIFGIKVYSILGQPEPDPELLKIYASFTHLTGDYRSKLAQALWEAQTEMKAKGISSSSPKAGEIFNDVFNKWGIGPSLNQ